MSVTVALSTALPRIARRTGALVALLATAACGDDEPTTPASREFLRGTAQDAQVGVVVNSLAKSISLFQLGDPEEQRQIALGASSAVTPTTVSIRGRRAIVPLGNAASVALIDLAGERVERFFTLPSGNATGGTFADDTTILVANLIDDYVGRATTGQASGAITQTAPVAPAPAQVLMARGRALVISGNLDADFAPIGNSVVTALDPATLAVLGTAQSGGTNAQSAAIGPDSLLYVLNTGDYVRQGSLTIVDPRTMAVVTTVADMGVGAGSITIDADGLAYISGYAFGTYVWDTRTRTFVRGADNPVCARLASDDSCRGAFDARADENGRVYQLFFGSQGLPPQIFVYSPGSFTLTDSIATAAGPSAIDIRKY